MYAIFLIFLTINIGRKNNKIGYRAWGKCTPDDRNGHQKLRQEIGGLLKRAEVLAEVRTNLISDRESSSPLMLQLQP